MGAYGSPELPVITTTENPRSRPRPRSCAAGVRFLRALRRTVVVILCVLGALVVLSAVLQATGHEPASNTAVVGR